MDCNWLIKINGRELKALSRCFVTYMDNNELLHKIDVRLARVEERLKDLAEIKKSVDNMRWRVAGMSGAVALAVSLAGFMVR